MAKVKKISKQIHGAASLAETDKNVQDTIGSTKLSGYKQSTLSEYSSFLNGLTLIDLHDHAISIANVVPINNRVLLIDRLEKEFARANTRHVPSGQTANNGMSPEDREAALRILRRGA